MIANIGKVWKSEAGSQKLEVKNTVINVFRLPTSDFRLGRHCLFIKTSICLLNKLPDNELIGCVDTDYV